MSKIVLTFFVTLVSFLTVSTVDAAGTRMNAAMQALPFTQLGIYTSHPGESEHAFLERMAPILQKFTARTGDEACAAIGRKGNSWGIVLGTNHAQVGCLAGEAGVVEGMTWTGETIHSHPAGEWLDLTSTDLAYGRATGRVFMGRRFQNHPNGFSREDFRGGPGYLVAGGRLLYQNHPTRHPIVIGQVQ